MIALCISGITEWLIQKEAIDTDDKELYEYAVHSLILSIMPIGMVLLIGIILGAVKEGLLMILPFMVIRKFSGGYHAKKEINCLIASGISLTLCVWLASWLNTGIFVHLLIGFAAFSLALCSPIDSKERQLNADEKLRYRRVTRILVTAFTGIYMLLLFLRLERYAVCIAIGVALSATLQIPCMVKRALKIE